MLPDKNENGNHKNCIFRDFLSYMLFLTQYCTNIKKNFQEKLLFLNKK